MLQLPRLLGNQILLVLLLSTTLFAQESDHVVQVGRLYNQWSGVDDLEIAGDFAYLATGLTGLQIVDISDPFRPNFTSYYDYLDNASLVRISDQRAYVGSGDAGPVSIIDIQDPVHPSKIGQFDVAGNVWDMTVDDHIAYIASVDNGLQVYDVHNPDFPVLINVVDTLGRVYYVAKQGDRLFVLSQRGAGKVLRVIDATDPVSLTELGSYSARGSKIVINGDYLYLMGGFNGVWIWDISDVFGLHQVGEYHDGVDYRDIAVDGNLLYLSGYACFAVVDVTDHNAPQLIADFDSDEPFRASYQIALHEQTVLLGGGRSGSYAGVFLTVDVSEPQALHLDASVSNFGQITDVAVRSDIAVVVDASNGVRTVDIGHPDAAIELDSIGIGNDIEFVKISDDYAYVVADHLYIIDISDPVEIRQVADLVPPMDEFKGEFYDLAFVGDYAYCSWSGDIMYGLMVYNVSDPSSPDSVAFYSSMDDLQLPHYPWQIASRDHYLFSFCGWPHCIIACDVTNPRQISEGGYLQVSDSLACAKLLVSGNLLLIADNGRNFNGLKSGVWIFDVSDIASPRFLAHASLPPGACDMTVSGSRLIVACENAGIYVLDISDPEHPEQVGFFNTSGFASGVASQGDLVILADYSNLGFYDLSPLAVEPDRQPTLPSSSGLLSAFPNPFNSSTTISYTLPTSGRYALTVTDITGREVARLSDGWKEAGSYRETLNATHYSTGEYFIRVQGVDGIVSQSVILLK